MREDVTVAALAIIPCKELASARLFWERLGFATTDGFGDYVILQGWGCEVHLQPTGGDYPVPHNNPFGVFIRTPQVEAVAARVPDLIIKPGGVLRDRDWGMYEFAVNGPDNLLVRVGWPSRRMEALVP